MSIKILLIDDETDIVEGTKIALESKGFNVIYAYDGLSGFNKAREEKPDIVLLDVFMPVLHGYEVCKKLKEDDSLKHIPIIFFSAGKGLPKEAKDVGAADFIDKIFDLEELTDKIHYYTKK